MNICTQTWTYNWIWRLSLALFVVGGLFGMAHIANAQTYSLDVSDRTITLGEPVTVEWDNGGTYISRDWIGFYRTGSNDNRYQSWAFANTPDGTYTVTPDQVGTYEFRMFFNYGYTQLAESQTVTVELSDDDNDNGVNNNDFSISTNRNNYDVGDSIRLEWSGAPAGSGDWIGLYRENASDRSYQSWQYVSSRSGSLTFTLDDPGRYEVRYFLNNGYTKAGKSNIFTVAVNGDNGNDDDQNNNDTSYNIDIDDRTISPGQSIRAKVSGPNNSNGRDWVGLYRTSGSDRQYLSYTYIRSNNQDIAFTINQVGTYELRYFLNNGYTKAYTSNEIRVSQNATGGGSGGGDNDDQNADGYSLSLSQNRYDRNETIRVNWTAPAGTNISFDWIGLYRPNARDTQYLDFEYVDRLSNTETFRVNTPGEYELRYFKNNRYIKVATSNTFNVGNVDNDDNGTLTCNLPTNNIENFPPPNGPIIAFGDSLTAGIGAEDTEGYVGKLEDRLDINIRNEGVSGDTTRDALDRLQRDVLRRDPSVVIVFLGGNDEIRRSYDDLSMTLVGRALQDELDEIAEEVNYDWESVPLISRNETFENIETIVERIQDTGAVTIIVGLDNTIFDASINERYRQVARNTDSFFVSDIYDGVFGRPRFMADLVHPNEDGYEIFADRIQPALTCALPN